MTIQSAYWGVDDDGAAYAEFDGERATMPIAAKSKSGWLDPMTEAHHLAHEALQDKIGQRIEYYRLDKSHPHHG